MNSDTVFVPSNGPGPYSLKPISGNRDEEFLGRFPSVLTRKESLKNINNKRAWIKSPNF